MDQILPVVETLLSRIDWISALLSGLCGVVVGGFATMFARGFELEGWRYKAVWVVIAAISFWPVRSGARTYVAPPIYEWTHEDRLVAELSRFPFYKALLDHHPESRKPLVRAAIKVKWGRQESLVGASELNAIIDHYLAQDLPHTSDEAAKQLALAFLGLFHHLLNSDPALCVAQLYGSDSQRETINRFARLSPMVLDRIGQVAAQVVTDAATNPVPAPDAARMDALQQRVIERMTSDGNPIVTNPDQAMSDPQRTCFAAMASYETAWKVVPEAEFGAFLRATLPLLFADDEI